MEVHDRRGGTYFDSGRHEAVYDATMRGIAEGITFEQALTESLRVQHEVGTAFLPASKACTSLLSSPGLTDGTGITGCPAFRGHDTETG